MVADLAKRELAPLALHAYCEAYTDFKRSMVALVLEAPGGGAATGSATAGTGTGAASADASELEQVVQRMSFTLASRAEHSKAASEAASGAGADVGSGGGTAAAAVQPTLAEEAEAFAGIVARAVRQELGEPSARL